MILACTNGAKTSSSGLQPCSEVTVTVTIGSVKRSTTETLIVARMETYFSTCLIMFGR
jgi:hypothetical protein